MHEILKRLSPGARVLDLGCAHGSFRDDDSPCTVVRCDLDSQSGSRFARFVRGDARLLPFADGSFDAIILNHSLEHFADPASVLSEIRRVSRQPTYLYVAVPDATTITDRLYRWFSRGGGHVNLFPDAGSLVRLVETRTGLRHVATRLLFSSFSFLNRHNGSRGYGRRIFLVGGGAERVLRMGTFVLRQIDRVFGTRTSIYGWALYFGGPMEVDTSPWSNVCIRCGTGISSDWLVMSGRVRRSALGIRLFRCPDCGVENCFTDDRAYLSMR